MTPRRSSVPPRSRTTRRIVLVALVAALVIAGGFFYQRSGERDEPRDGAPNWSPDGQQIVFAAEVGETASDIYVMRRDGSGRRRLTDAPARDSTPAFSPDGNQIAFESDRDGNPEIYVMDANGRNVRRLTNDPATDLAPAWSPDGRRIAFTSDRNQRAAADVYTVNAADGSDLQRLTSDLSNWAPQYARDGQSLALQIGRDVYVMNLADRQVTRLTSDPQNGMNPTWAPDGQQIAFVSTRNRRAEIFAMHRDGSNQRVLVTLPTGWLIDPRWSPDGAYVAFVLLPDQPPPGQKPERQGIYTVEVATGKIERVSP